LILERVAARTLTICVSDNYKIEVLKMPQGTVTFFTIDGKMRLTLSGTYSKLLEEIDVGGVFAVTEFSGVVFVDSDREVEVSGDDKLVPTPEPGTIYKEMVPDTIDPSSPTTPTKTASTPPALASIAANGGIKFNTTAENKNKIYATPLRNEEPDNKEKDEFEQNKKTEGQADKEHHGEIVDVDHDDDSVDFDYDYSQQVNWVDEETMMFMLGNSSPQIESRFNAGSPDTKWSGKNSVNKNKNKNNKNN
jgi:hypothetical protein